MDDMLKGDQERKEFLKDCDFVVKVPLTWNLSEFSGECQVTVLPLRLYVYVGVIKGGKRIKVSSRHFDPKSKTFLSSDDISDTAFVPLFYSKLSSIFKTLKGKRPEWLKTSEYRIWSHAPFLNPYLDMKGSVNIAFCFLLYSLINNLSKEKLNDMGEAWRALVKSAAQKECIDIVKAFKSENQSVKSAINMFRFCHSMPSVNGASVLLSLFGTPEKYCGITYRVECDCKEKASPADLKIDEIFENGSIKIWAEENSEYPFDLLLAYSEEKRDKFWGPVLSPYLFDEAQRLRLTIATPRTSSYGIEKWMKRFTYQKGYLEFFAPTSVIKNVREELEGLEKSFVFYSSDMLPFPWDIWGAELLKDSEFKPAKIKTARAGVSKPLIKIDEKPDYEIYLAKDRGIGAESLEASNSKVEKVYLEDKDAYDIFVYTRSAYSKRRDERSGKYKFMPVDLDQRMYILLVLFLKYKDSSLDVYALHKKAWDHVPKDYDGRPDYKKTMEYLKSTISEMKSKIGVDSLEIKKPRNSEGYICTGKFKFCVIIDKSQSSKYNLSDFDIRDED